MPAPVDSNSPAFWWQSQLRILTSANAPLLSIGGSQFYEMRTVTPTIVPPDNLPLWIEAAWLDENGTLYAWYHHEPGGLCSGSRLTAPWIGALVSTNGGRTFFDLGKILEAAEAPDCSAKNGWFAGGHGDFSVIVDEAREFFYFYFSTYGGEVERQGVAVARMPFALRQTPVGNVWKFHEGDWNEPGIGGRVTPAIRTAKAWQRADADSFWGPSLHWNHHLESWVMLLSRSCCEPAWPQEGIYVSFNPDLTNPTGWSAPQAILKGLGFEPGWYPQVLGTQIGETDKIAGRLARLYVHGVSRWELIFHRADGLSAPPSRPSRGEEELSAPVPEPTESAPVEPTTEPPPSPIEPDPAEP